MKGIFLPPLNWDSHGHTCKLKGKNQGGKPRKREETEMMDRQEMGGELRTPKSQHLQSHSSGDIEGTKEPSSVIFGGLKNNAKWSGLKGPLKDMHSWFYVTWHHYLQL